MSPSKLFIQIAFGWWFLVFSLLFPTEISMKTMVENVTKTTLNTQVLDLLKSGLGTVLV